MASDRPGALGYCAVAFANLVPLAGLLFLGWQGETVIVLYFVEAAIIYVLTARMLAVVAGLRGLNLLPGYLLRYGLGLLMMGAIWYALAGIDARVLRGIFAAPGLWIGVAGMLTGHLLSYFMDFIGRKEYENLAWKSIEARMLAVYATLFLLVLFFGWVLAIFGSPRLVAAALVIGKTFVALSQHSRERARGAAGAAPEYAASTAACPKCGKPLRTNMAKQCYHCGADWHRA